MQAALRRVTDPEPIATVARQTIEEASAGPETTFWPVCIARLAIETLPSFSTTSIQHLRLAQVRRQMENPLS